MDSDPPRERGSIGTRLAIFAALAAFGAIHWAGFVVDPPFARTALAVLAITLGGAVLATIGRSELGTMAAWTLAAATVVAATVVSLVAIGLPVRFVSPTNWGELAANVDLGLSAVASDDFNYPYAGENEWARLSVLLGAPLLLGLAAAAAFWPRRRVQALSLLGVGGRAPIPTQALGMTGLAILVILYAVPATENPSGAPLIGGLALFLLVAGWLWLPGLRNRDAGVAIAAVAVAGAVALPFATQLEDAEGWIDYRNWAWSSDAGGVTFNWNHSYGPIDWPRDDRTVLRVESDQPRYSKLATLDLFDGRRWLTDPAPQESLELPGEVSRTTTFPLLQPAPEEWLTTVRVQVRELQSNLVPGPGTIRAHRGLGRKAPRRGNGGTWELGTPLETGDVFEARTYAPDPDPERLRESEGRYPRVLERSTRIGIPGEVTTERSPECQEPGLCVQVPADEETGRPAELRVVDEVVVPLWGAPAAAERVAAAETRLSVSAYGQMLDLAQEVTAGEETAYDAAKALETHLRENYEYSEFPPDRTFPLSDFLFEDGIGYCQQFSGAMALMARMVGLPARVVTGFAPGERDPEDGTFVVRNLDAHSWVEVFFNDIGWVTFDPTPAASPAANQTNDGAGSDQGPGEQSSAGLGDDAGAGGTGGQEAASADATSGGLSPALLIPIVALALALAGLGWVGIRALAARRLEGGAMAAAQLRELQAALPRLGVELPASATLLRVERALGKLTGSAGSSYAAKLRAGRFAPGASPPPSAEDRRALRRGLSTGRGLRGRVLALLALPPGGPRA